MAGLPSIPSQTATNSPSLDDRGQHPRAASTPSITAPAIPSYTHYGCYDDNTDRLLNGTIGYWKRQDPAFCCSWCLNINTDYTWCGVEAGYQCLCDSITSNFPVTKIAASSCSMHCPGANDYYCGADWVIDLYGLTAPIMTDATPTAPLSVQSLPGYSYHGCWTDDYTPILSAVMTSLYVGDPQYCCEWCLGNDEAFRWCGMETDTCFCGTYMPSTAVSASPGDCSAPCPGVAEYQCGGAYRINVYEATAPSSTTPTISTTSTKAAAAGTTQETGRPETQPALSGGDIAGVVVGSVAAVLSLSVCALWCCRHRLVAAFSRRYGQGSNNHTAGDVTPLSISGPEIVQYTPMHPTELQGDHTRRPMELQGDQKRPPTELQGDHTRQLSELDEYERR